MVGHKTWLRVLFCLILLKSTDGLCAEMMFSRKNQVKQDLNVEERKCRGGGCSSGVENEQSYDLLTFASFSMPDESLISFSRELELYGGAFVLRGIPENSFEKFFNKVNQLREKGVNAPVLIDPDSFEDYEVESVPVTVLRGAFSFDKVVGNVPVSFALESFSKRGSEKKLAKEVLKRAGGL